MFFIYFSTKAKTHIRSSKSLNFDEIGQNHKTEFDLRNLEEFYTNTSTTTISFIPLSLVQKVIVNQIQYIKDRLKTKSAEINFSVSIKATF